MHTPSNDGELGRLRRLAGVPYGAPDRDFNSDGSNGTPLPTTAGARRSMSVVPGGRPLGGTAARERGAVRTAWPQSENLTSGVRIPRAVVRGSIFGSVNRATIAARGTSQLGEATRATERHAQALGAKPPGTQHLLLALVEQQDAMAARVLAGHAVTRAAMHRAIIALGTAETRMPDLKSGGIAFSRELDGVLREANRYSNLREDHYIGTPHVLRAIVGADECLGHRVLCDLGVDLELLVAAVERSLLEHPEAQRDWSVVRRRHEQLCQLSRSDELELARSAAIGHAVLEAMTDDERAAAPPLRTLPGDMPVTWQVVREAARALGALVEGHFRLVLQIAEVYERDGHDPFWIYGRAERALRDAASTWVGDEAAQQQLFSDYARAHIVDRVEEDLTRRDCL